MRLLPPAALTLALAGGLIAGCANEQQPNDGNYYRALTACVPPEPGSLQPEPTEKSAPSSPLLPQQPGDRDPRHSLVPAPGMPPGDGSTTVVVTIGACFSGGDEATVAYTCIENSLATMCGPEKRTGAFSREFTFQRGTKVRVQVNGPPHPCYIRTSEMVLDASTTGTCEATV